MSEKRKVRLDKNCVADDHWLLKLWRLEGVQFMRGVQLVYRNLWGPDHWIVVGKVYKSVDP